MLHRNSSVLKNTKNPLIISDLLKTEKVFIRYNRTLENLKKRRKFKSLFKRHPKLLYDPRVPEYFSLSIIYYILRYIFKIKIKQISIPRNQNLPDLIYLLLNTISTNSIEVKATQKQRFTRFSSKDIKADVLVWIDFYDYFSNIKNGIIKIYFIQKPILVRYKIKDGGHKLKRVLKIINNECGYLKLDLKEFFKTLK